MNTAAPLLTGRFARALVASLTFPILLLLLTISRLDADPPAADSEKADSSCFQPVAQDDMAEGLKVLAQLKGLGAAAERRLPEHACRERYLSTIQQARFELPRPEDETKPHEVVVALGEKWKGSDDDLEQINSLLPLGKVRLNIASFRSVSPRSLARLKLRQPLAALGLSGVTDETVRFLSALPPAEGVRFQAWKLTPWGWQRFATIAGDLEALDCVGNGPYEAPAGIIDDDLAAIATTKNLHYLRLYGARVSAAGLKHLAAMEHLETLILEYCHGLEETDLAPLADLAGLRRLELKFPVSAAAIVNIARLEGLEKLDIVLGQIEPADVEPLGRLTNLQKLVVSHTAPREGHAGGLRIDDGQSKSRLRAVPLGNAIGQAAGKMPRLKTLRQRVPMGAPGVEGLAGAPHLRTLVCELVPLSDAALVPLARLTALEELRINARMTPEPLLGKFSDTGLAALEKLYQLVVIELPGRGLSDAGLAHLAGLAKLEGLHLSGSKITGSGLAALGQLTDLRSLSLNNAPIDDETCSQFLQFPLLETLNLSQTNVTDAGMEIVGQIGTLVDLGISDTVVSDAGLAKLDRLKHLRMVSATHSDITETGISRLQATLPNARVHIPSAADRRHLPRGKPGPRDPDDPLDLIAVDDATDDELETLDEAARKPRPPATQESAKRAVERLTSLGANVMDQQGSDGERQINIFFSLWKGSSADLDLLNDLFILGKVDATFDFRNVSPKSLSKLRLDKPLENLSLYNASDRALEQLKHLPSTRAVSLHLWNLTPAGYHRLAELAGDVESLRFYGFRSEGKWRAIADAGLAELAGLTNLKELTIRHSPLTVAGIQTISGLQGLEYLRLMNCPALAGADLSPLGNLAALRKLELETPLSASSLAGIARLGALEELTFVLADSTPADVEPLARLDHLRTLAIVTKQSLEGWPDGEPPAAVKDTALGDAIARIARAKTNLQTLVVHAAMSEQRFAQLAELKKLTSLGLRLDRVTDQTLALCGRLSKLRSLSLQGEGKLTDQGLEPLEHLTELTGLSLPAAGLTDGAISHLAPLTSLKSLSLVGGRLSGKGLASLKSAEALEQLGLADSTFADSDCPSLARFANLRTLDLSRSKITDAALTSIATLPKLETLILDGTKFTQQGFAPLNGRQTPLFVLARHTPAADAVRARKAMSPDGMTVYIFSNRSESDDDKPEPDAAAE